MSATILIFALLKIIVVKSTTLFLPGESIFSQQVQLFLGHKFDSGLLWNSITPKSLMVNGEEHVYACVISEPSGIIYNNISADPIWAYSNLRKEYSESAPPLELSTEFTSFSIGSRILGRGIEVSTDVDVFQSNTTCEIAEVDWARDEFDGTVHLTMRTPSCNIGRVKIPMCFFGTDPIFSFDKSQFFMVERVNCTGDGVSDTVLTKTTPNTYQYAVVVFEIDSSVLKKDKEGTYLLFDLARAARVVAVSCGLTYSIRQGMAKAPTLDTTHLDALDMENNNKLDDGGIINFTSLPAI